LLNTIILISSGVTVTYSHHSLLKNYLNRAKLSLLLTIILGVYFTVLQGYEYLEAMYSISDSVFGRIFFVATGFHGLHVLIGSTLLLVIFFRITFSQFSSRHHFGFEAAA
jgi:cytochrome c oxidase subunit 3